MKLTRIFSQALKITWKNKVLWLFGVIGTLFSIWVSFQRISAIAGNPGVGQPTWAQSIRNNPELIFLYCGELVLIGVVLIAVATYGRLGLILGILKTQERKAVKFRQITSQIRHFFWRAIGLFLVLTFLPVLAYLVIALIWLVLSFAGTFATLCFIPLALVAGLAAFGYAIYAQLANYVLIIEDISVSKAIEKSWTTFKYHWGKLGLLTVILFALSLLLTYLIDLPYNRNIAAAILANSGATFANLYTLFLYIFIVFVAVYNGFFYTFSTSSWILVYEKLKVKKRARPSKKGSAA
jgi:hypothetical protein